MLVRAFYWQWYSPPREKTPGLLLTNIPPPPSPGSLLHTTSVLCSTQTYMTILFLHFIFWIICYGNSTTNLNVSSRYLEKFSCLEWRFIKYFSILGTSNREKNFISMKYFDPDIRKMPKHLIKNWKKLPKNTQKIRKKIVKSTKGKCRDHWIRHSVYYRLISE